MNNKLRDAHVYNTLVHNQSWYFYCNSYRTVDDRLSSLCAVDHTRERMWRLLCSSLYELIDSFSFQEAINVPEGSFQHWLEIPLGRDYNTLLHYLLIFLRKVRIYLNKPILSQRPIGAEKQEVIS